MGAFEVIGRWFIALVTFIVGSTLILTFSNLTINGNYGIENFGYVVLLLIIGIFAIQIYRIVKGE